MSKRDLWMADRFWFRVHGRDPQRFLNRVSARGIRLAKLRWEPDGVTAQAFGPDYEKMLEIARQGGWEFTVLHRRGPGLGIHRLLSRPGLVAGTALFFLLLQIMSHLVWSIDFGNLEGEPRERMRTLLEESGIREGTYLREETFAIAQTRALQQSDVFGWISLNFAGGCLYIESTPAQSAEIREDAPMTPLYAKTGGEILAVQTESGFTAVTVGQQVEAGQLLVDVVRLDRNGNQVPQGASGRILARCQQTYTALQPRQEVKTILTGNCETRDTLYAFGTQWTSQEEMSEGLVQTDWLPLRLGRLSLPASLCRETVWQQAEEELFYSQEQAGAMAQRDCRAQLLAEFPDAQIEAERCQVEDTPEGVLCTVTYQFCANIAAAQS